jgi:MFS transporter, DHA1 family, inner membrane transport protein
MTSRPTVLASTVLALALLGDSLLYAVLPLHATTFGISLAWVGVLLSANRLIRLFAYPLLPRLATTGLRRFTIIAAALGGLTTLTFAVASGAWLLLASRIVWGVVFGALSLSTLAYATEWSEVAGKRVGLSLALREVGPLLSLTIGTAAVSMAGVRPTLAILGMMSLAGVIVATRLPELEIANDARRATTPGFPVSADWLSLVAGFVTDGIFPATIGLLIAKSAGPGEAVMGAGLLLAIKRVAVVVFAPVSGHASDRFGGHLVAAAGFGIAGIGTLLIAGGGVITGAILISCGAAATTAAIPVSIAVRDANERVAAFARAAMARDTGAAAGPLAALLSFNAAGAGVLYSTSGVLLAAMAMWLVTASHEQPAVTER